MALTRFSDFRIIATGYTMPTALNRFTDIEVMPSTGANSYTMAITTSLAVDDSYTRTLSATRAISTSLALATSVSFGSVVQTSNFTSSLAMDSDYIKGTASYPRSYDTDLTLDSTYDKKQPFAMSFTSDLALDTSIVMMRTYNVNWLRKGVASELVTNLDDGFAGVEMVMYGGIPYVFYSKLVNSKSQVFGRRKYNGTWENLNGGNTLSYTADRAYTIKAAVVGTQLCLVWSEYNTSDSKYYVRCKYFDGTTWNTGQSGTSTVTVGAANVVITINQLIYSYNGGHLLHIIYSKHTTGAVTHTTHVSYTSDSTESLGYSWLTPWQHISSGANLCYNNNTDTSGISSFPEPFAVWSPSEYKILLFLPEVNANVSVGHRKVDLRVKDIDGNAMNSGNILEDVEGKDFFFGRAVANTDGKIYIALTYNTIADEGTTIGEFITYNPTGDTFTWNSPSKDIIGASVAGLQGSLPVIYGGKIYLVGWGISGTYENDFMAIYNLYEDNWKLVSYIEDLDPAYISKVTPDCITGTGGSTLHGFIVDNSTEIYYTTAYFDPTLIPYTPRTYESTLTPDTDVSYRFIPGQLFVNSLALDATLDRALHATRTFESPLALDSSYSRGTTEVNHAIPVLVADDTSNYDLSEGGSNNIARDSLGYLYVVATYQTTYYEIRCFKSVDNGETWQSLSFPSQGNYHQYRPSIAIDSNNNLHVVWYGLSSSYPSNSNIMYSKYSNGSWSSTLNLTPGTRTQSHPCIAIGSNNYLHVAWVGATATQTAANVRYVRYSTTWESIVDITNDNYTRQSPHIAVPTDTNMPHIAWSGLSSTRQATYNIYKIYRNANLTWSSIQAFTSDIVYNCYAPQISMESSTNWVLAWYGKDVINTTYDTILARLCIDNLQYGNYYLINTKTSNQRYVTASYDRSGKPNAVWIGRTSGSVDKLVYSKFIDIYDEWTSPVELNTNASAYPSSVQGFTNFSQPPTVWTESGNIYFGGIFTGQYHYTRTYESPLALTDEYTRTSSTSVRTYESPLALGSSLEMPEYRTYDTDLTLDSDYISGNVASARTYESPLSIDDLYTRSALTTTRTYDTDLAMSTLYTRGLTAPREYLNDLALSGSLAMVFTRGAVTYESSLSLDTDYTRTASFTRPYDTDLSMDSSYSRLLTSPREYLNDLALSTSYTKVISVSMNFESGLALSSSYDVTSGEGIRVYTSDLSLDTDYTRTLDTTREFVSPLAVDTDLTMLLTATRTYDSDLAIDSSYDSVVVTGRNYTSDLAVDTDYTTGSLTSARTYDTDLTLDGSLGMNVTEAIRSYSSDLSLGTLYTVDAISYVRDYSSDLTLGTLYTRLLEATMETTTDLTLDSSLDLALQGQERFYDTDLTMDTDYTRTTQYTRNYDTDLSLDTDYSRYLISERDYIDDLTLDTSYTREAGEVTRTFSTDITLDMQYNRIIEYEREFAPSLGLDTSYDTRVTWSSDLTLDMDYIRATAYYRDYSSSLALNTLYASGARSFIATTVDTRRRATLEIETRRKPTATMSFK